MQLLSPTIRRRAAHISQGHLLAYDNGTCVSTYSCYYSPSYYPYYYFFTVQLGTTVMWFNYGSVSHTVTSSPTNKAGLQIFDSGSITHFGSFSVTFNTAG